MKDHKKTIEILKLIFFWFIVFFAVSLIIIKIK